MKPRSIKAIDRACRDDSLFVYIGNRQKVYGVAKYLGMKDEEAPTGYCWADVANKQEWQQVKITDIIIERRGGNQVKGKRGPRPAIRSSKKAAAKANNNNLELPGTEVDQRKIREIEDAEEARQSASEALTVAHTALEEAEEVLIKAMHKHGFDVDDHPLYMRNPWGGVVLTKSGEVKERAKFIKSGNKAKKKKKEE